MSEKDDKLAEAIATANEQCKTIHRLILEDKFSWMRMPDAPDGVQAFHGTGEGGYNVIIGKGPGGYIGSCFGGAPQVTVLRNEFAQFCYEAAEAALAKKN